MRRGSHGPSGGCAHRHASSAWREEDLENFGHRLALGQGEIVTDRFTGHPSQPLQREGQHALTLAEPLGEAFNHRVGIEKVPRRLLVAPDLAATRTEGPGEI